MSLVQINQVDFSYDLSVSILKEISLEIEQNEFVSLLGPSGCGKSTLLNLIAGFNKVTSGEIHVFNSKVDKPSPDRGVVFQDLALFPWLNVLGNVEFGLKMKRIPKQKRRQKALNILELVGLKEKEHLPISALSGGMKQRVAIARTLISEPKVLLMDEPFSALDAQTREQLQDELLTIHKQIGTTVIFVTHSIDEAIYLSDRVVFLSKNGAIKHIEKIQLERPRDRMGSTFNEYKRLFHNLLKEEQQQEGNITYEKIS